MLILLGGLIGYITYLVALKISKDVTLSSIIGLVVFVLILFGGWSRVGGVPIF
jgi:hypothetical protein